MCARGAHGNPPDENFTVSRGDPSRGGFDQYANKAQGEIDQEKSWIARARQRQSSWMLAIIIDHGAADRDMVLLPDE